MKNRHATILCCLYMGIFAMSITMLGPLLGAISERFSLSLTESGLLFTINFLGFVIFTLIGGAITERFGKKAVLTVSMFGLAASSFIIAFSTSFPLILVMMFIYGGFGGIVETFASALISDLNPEHSAYYINLSQVFFGVGAVIAPLIAGSIVSSAMNYNLCYIGLGVLCLISAIDFACLKLPPLKGDAGITVNDLKQLFSNKIFWLVCLCMFCYTGSEVGTWGWMSTFLQKNLEFSPIYSSIALATFWLAMTIGRFTCGELTKKFKLSNIILGLASASTVVVLLSGFATRSTFFIIAFLLGLGCSSLFPLIMAYGDGYVTKAKNSAFALFVVTANTGSLVIPYLIGLIGDQVGIRAAMMFPSIFFFIVVAVFLYFKSYEKKQSRSKATI